MQSKLPNWIVYVTPDNFDKHIANILASAKVMAKPQLGFDTETTGLRAHRDDIRLVQFSDGVTAWVMDAWQVGMDRVATLMASLLQNQVTLIGHNVTFDLGFMLKYGIKYYLPYTVVDLDARAERRWCETFDTMVAAKVIECGLRGFGFKLSEVLERVLDITLDKELQRSDWSVMELSPEQIIYAARDTLHMIELRRVLDEVIEDCDLVDTIYRVEMPCLAATANMTTKGLRVDLKANAILKSKLEKEAIEELENWHNLVGRSGKPVNLNSPKQVTEAFAQIGIFLTSTAKDTVEKLDHPAGMSLSRYRSLSKLISSYCNSFEHPEVVDPFTGMSYPGLDQGGAESGRYTGRSSNLTDEGTGKKIKSINWQAIPRDNSMQGTGLSFRELVIAPDGEVVVDADYAQIELRLMAIWSRDAKMCGAMESGADLHGETAENVFGANKQGTDWKWWRDLAKRFNFAVANGVKAKKLSAMSEGKLSLKAADAKIKNWFEYYNGLGGWFRDNGNDSVKRGYSVTMMGRRRYYPNNMFPEDTYREANSTSIQGSSADLTKLALGFIIRDELDPRLPIHDEVILYAPRDGSEDHAARLESCMVNAAGELMKRLPSGAWNQVKILADAGVGPSWAQAKK